MTLAGLGGAGRWWLAFGLGALGQATHEAGPARLGRLDDRWRSVAWLGLDLGLRRRTAFFPLAAMRSPGFAFTRPELRPPGLLARVLRRPAPRHPEIAGTTPVPVAVDPDLARAGRQSTVFDPGRRCRRIEGGRISGSVSRAVAHRSRHHGAARQGRDSKQEKRETRCHGGIVDIHRAAHKQMLQLLTAVTPGYRAALAAQGRRGWANSCRSGSQRPASSCQRSPLWRQTGACQTWPGRGATQWPACH